MAMKFIS